MKSIWKFPITKRMNEYGAYEVLMPSDHKILSVQVQGDVPCIWAEVDPESEVKAKTLFIVGTGKYVPDAVTRFIGTFQQSPFVWHLYE